MPPGPKSPLPIQLLIKDTGEATLIRWRVCVFNNVTYQFTEAGNGWNVEGSASAEILDPIVRGQTLTGGALILTHVGLQFSSGLLAERQFGSGACQVSDNLHKNSYYTHAIF